jgi:protein-disulfide isomerase
MKRLVVLSLLFAACTHAAPPPVCPPVAAHDAELERKVDMLILKVDGLEAKLKAAPPAAAHAKPDPLAIYAVDVTGDPFVGPADALVTVVKAQDYDCQFCYRSEPTMAQLLADYPGKLRVVYKDYVVHPQTATLPALAACAAQAQGRFAEFNAALWDKAFNKDTGEPMMVQLAKELKLDLTRFSADMKGPACKQALARDQEQLNAVGVSGTPSFFINGRYLAGARPLEQFKQLVDEELKKAEAALGKNGVSASNYYEKVVVAGGKKTL